MTSFYISLARICIFLMWIETKPSFSSNSLKEDCLSLQTIRKHLSWSLFILLLFVQLWHIQTRRQKLNCEVKKAFMSMRFFAVPMYGVTLVKADIFLPAFLQISEIWSSEVTFLSNFTPNSFLVSLLSILNPSSFRLTLSLVLTNKWHLSASLLKRLFLSYSNKLFDAWSRDVIRSFTL